MRILGLNYSSHDAAASLVENGKVVAACEEERYSREKHSKKIPLNAIKSCLDIAGTEISGVDRIAFFVDPSLQYRLILSNLAAGFPESVLYIPRGIQLARKRFNMLPILKEHLGLDKFPPVDFVPHHTAHAASSFLPSNFDRAAVLTVDGRGEYETAAIFLGEGNKLKKMHHVTFPHSLGYFYSMITKYLGFRQHHDEYKVMGLSAYGKPDLVKKLEEIVHSDSSGRLTLDLSYFDHHFRATKQRELFTQKFVQEFGEPRKPGEKTEQKHADMAFAAQKVTEKAILNLASYARQLTGQRKLCFSGGVALNCLANQRILESGLFDELFVQPAANDAGTSMGAALYSYFLHNPHASRVPLKDVYLGPSFSNDEILRAIEQDPRKNELAYSQVDSPEDVAANLIHKGEVIGWFNGRMEFGPRALGNRSILASPTDPEMKDKLNRKIKFREEFRPFAPAIMEEHFGEFFRHSSGGKDVYPYMLSTVNVLPSAANKIPAGVHADGTSRVQVVSRTQNAPFWNLINGVYRLSGVPVVLNTSLNVDKEPIVCTPKDAIHNFLKSGLDCLFMNNYLLRKRE